jgi:hypothetical protein
MRTLPWLAAAVAASSAGACILPDIHDEGAGAGGAGAGGAKNMSTTSAGPSTTSSSGMPGSGSSSGSTSASVSSSSTSSSSGQPACTTNAPIVFSFTNVAPAAGAVDFCLGANGNLSGPVAKLAAAPAGLAYATTMGYTYDVSGAIDIRVIAAGGACSGTSLGDITNLCLHPNGQNSATVYYTASLGAAAAPLVVLADEAPSPTQLRIRFFNAVVGATSLDFGLTAKGALPTTVSPTIATNVLIGHVPPPGPTVLNVPVNAAGFMDITSLPASITWGGWGAAISGAPAAVAVAPFTTVSSNVGVTLTIVAVGKVGSTTYPVQFLGYNAAQTGTMMKPATQGSTTHAGLI